MLGTAGGNVFAQYMSLEDEILFQIPPEWPIFRREGQLCSIVRGFPTPHFLVATQRERDLRPVGVSN
jgi:hypothetical protein